MKKLISVVCAAAVALSLSGCGIFSDEVSRSHRVISADRVDTVYIEDNSHDVEIGISPDSSIHIECLESNTKKYSIREGEALQIKAPNYSSGLPDTELEDDLVLLIPADYTGEIFVDTSSGDVEIGVLTPSTVRITTASGEVSLTGTAVSGPVNILTASGEVELSDITSDSVTVETSSGDVDIENVYSDSFNITTASGEVDCTLSGSMSLYAVSSVTSSGKSNLPEKAGDSGIPFVVTTSSGNIDVTFVLDCGIEIDYGSAFSDGDNAMKAARDMFCDKAAEIEQYSENYLSIAETQLEMNTESQNVYEKWDALLNEVYYYLSLTMDESEFDRLSKDEAKWAAEREKAVEEAGKEYEGGTIVPLVRNSTGIEYTGERFYCLIDLFK